MFPRCIYITTLCCKGKGIPLKAIPNTFFGFSHSEAVICNYRHWYASLTSPIHSSFSELQPDAAVPVPRPTPTVLVVEVPPIARTAILWKLPFAFCGEIKDVQLFLLRKWHCFCVRGGKLLSILSQRCILVFLGGNSTLLNSLQRLKFAFT